MQWFYSIDSKWLSMHSAAFLSHSDSFESDSTSLSLIGLPTLIQDE